jgi:homoserine kinase type II
MTDLDSTLAGVLSRYPAPLRPLSGPEPLGNAGGLSGARLWRYASDEGALVARAWPPGRPGRESLERVHAWLAEAGGLGFIPVPHSALDGRTLQEAGGQLWELAPWMPGEADPGRPPPPARLRAGFVALGLLHRQWGRHRVVGRSRGLAVRAREIGALLEGGFDDLERALPADGGGDPRCRLARQWLTLARRLAPRLLGPARHAAEQDGPLQPCVRDVRPDHLLFRGDCLSGLIDFGTTAIDSVAFDLARLLSEWVGPDGDSRAAALAAYESVRPLESVEHALIEAFEQTTALLMGSHWIRWHFLKRRTFEDPAAVLQGLQRGLDRLADLAISFEDVADAAGWLGHAALCPGHPPAAPEFENLFDPQE